MFNPRPLVATIAILVAFAGCDSGGAPPGRGELWPAADTIFHRDLRFLGGDGAYSIDLGAGRVLWLFGDSFIARDAERRRSDAAFIRNAVAIQTGADPIQAYMRFSWRYDGDEPRSFFPEPDAEHWFWPAHGIRLDHVLLIFLERLRNEGLPSPTSFRDAGWDAVVVDNPDDEPANWHFRAATIPVDGPSLLLGEAVVRDGDFIDVYATRGSSHAIALARFAVADAQLGQLAHPSYWCGDRFAENCAPTDLVSLGMPEFSVHWDARLEQYIMVGSAGYGSTTLAWRTASRPSGPWSEPRDVYRPPESFRDGAFVYAGKAHPALDGAGGLAATYVPSSFGDAPPELDNSLYFPHFVRIFAE